MISDNDTDRRGFLRVAALALAAGSGKDIMPDSWDKWHHPVRLAVADELSSLGSATAWINSPPLSEASLKGKVVLVQFWTFTCINWLRTLPYVRAWAGKYRKAGLVVIGVHAPEFVFERNLDNVRRSTMEMSVDYPVAVDNDYAIWRAFNNRYWPALYLLDAKAQVRHHRFGEGGYAETEGMVQQLLIEGGARDVDRQLTPVQGRGIEADADWADLRSAENYVGAERTENFASPGGVVPDRSRTYALPSSLSLNHWALAGDWTAQRDRIVLNQPNGRIAYRFHGRDLHLVMGPPMAARPVRYRVFLDGQPATAAHGIDVDEHGSGTTTEQRMHQLIRQPKPIIDRTFEIEFLDKGVEAFSFTFG